MPTLPTSPSTSLKGIDMKYAGYLSFSGNAYRIIVEGLPVCNDKATLLEALKAADSMHIVLHSLSWCGDKGDWVPLVTVE